MGQAAFWGMALIANNSIVFTLAIFSQLCNILFIQYVERQVVASMFRKKKKKKLTSIYVVLICESCTVIKFVKKQV